MAWLRLDDGFAEHDKILPLTAHAFRLHITGLLACARNLTDGHITNARFPPIAATAKATRKHADELERAGLWERVSDGWQIHDYLEYNASAEKVKSERLHAANRQAKFRAKKVYGQQPDDGIDYQAILDRDGHTCHLCKKGVKDADVHFDHVLPLSEGGQHTADNIRVTHARCNLRKNGLVTRDVTRDSHVTQGTVSHTTPSHPIPLLPSFLPSPTTDGTEGRNLKTGNLLREMPT